MCDLKCIFYIVGGEQACSNCLIQHENKITREEIEAQAELYSQILNLAYEENTRHTKEEGRKTDLESAELFQILIKGDLESCKEYIVKQADKIYDLRKEVEQLKKKDQADGNTGQYKMLAVDQDWNALKDKHGSMIFDGDRIIFSDGKIADVIMCKECEKFILHFVDGKMYDLVSYVHLHKDFSVLR